MRTIFVRYCLKSVQPLRGFRLSINSHLRCIVIALLAASMPPFVNDYRDVVLRHNRQAQSLAVEPVPRDTLIKAQRIKFRHVK